MGDVRQASVKSVTVVYDAETSICKCYLFANELMIVNSSSLIANTYTEHGGTDGMPSTGCRNSLAMCMKLIVFHLHSSV